MAAQRFVTVVGSSGSGKSSVVLAGLVPRLRTGGAVVATMVPGDQPVDALDAGAARGGHGGRRRPRRTRRPACSPTWPGGPGAWSSSSTSSRSAGHAPGRNERDAFLAVVADVLGDESVDVRFVTTVRADLLDRPLEHPTIGALVGAGSYVLAPLSPAELEEAIVQPAARVGVTFDDGVVADLVAEAVSYPGSLPLLQFTLTELYDRRVDGIISRQALEGIGGMAGAIGRRAEEVFDGLDEQRARRRAGAVRPSGRTGARARLTPAGGRCSASSRRACARSPTSSSPPGCSSPTATRRLVSRRSRWPTRRC